MSPSKIFIKEDQETIKCLTSRYTTSIQIDPYYDPFHPRHDFEEWLSRKTDTLKTPISEEVIDYSRVFNLYLYLSGYGHPIKTLKGFLKRPEDELMAIIENSKLKKITLKYDRYYYIFRLEQKLQETIKEEN